MESAAPSPAPTARPGHDGEFIDLREVMRKIWLRRRVVLVSIILCTAAAAGIIVAVTPLYSGEAYLVINAPEATKPGSSQIATDAGVEAVENESYVLRSRYLALRTIARLNLDRDLEFNPDLRSSNFFTKTVTEFAALTAPLARFVTGATPAATAPAGKTDADDGEPKVSTAVLTAFLRRLTVVVEERSRVIQLKFVSADPRIAAQVPNTLAALYLDSQRERKEHAARQGDQWIEERLAAVRGALQTSELAVADYRGKSGLIQGKDEGVATQELTDLNAQLVAARGRRDDAAARLERAEALLSAHGNDFASRLVAIEDVTHSPVIQNLREHEAQLEAKVGELSVSLAPKHPQMRKAEAELADARVAINAEIRRIADGLREQFAVAQATVDKLKQRLDALTKEVVDLDHDDVVMRGLQREADANRTLYERYLALSKTAQEAKGIPMVPDASIVSIADVPSVPFYPDRKIILLIGVVMGTGAGIILAAQIDQFVGGLRNGEQVESVLGTRCLGLVPRIAGSKRNARLLRLNRVGSSFWEAMRGIQVRLGQVAPPSRSQVVLVTSALPGEGKTSMAVSLSASLAADGHSVAVIDGDLHRPALHRQFEAAQAPGLTDFFLGEAGLAEIVRTDEVSGVHFIPAGAASAEHTGLLTYDRVRALVGHLAARFEFVIIDSAPILAASGTLVLAQSADRIVFIVRWGTTSQAIARHAVAQLDEFAGARAETLLSMVNMKRAAKYGDAAATVYRQLQKYYA